MGLDYISVYHKKIGCKETKYKTGGESRGSGEPESVSFAEFIAGGVKINESGTLTGTLPKDIILQKGKITSFGVFCGVFTRDY